MPGTQSPQQSSPSRRDIDGCPAVYHDQMKDAEDGQSESIPLKPRSTLQHSAMGNEPMTKVKRNDQQHAKSGNDIDAEKYLVCRYQTYIPNRGVHMCMYLVYLCSITVGETLIPTLLFSLSAKHMDLGMESLREREGSTV